VNMCMVLGTSKPGGDFFGQALFLFSFPRFFRENQKGPGSRLLFFFKQQEEKKKRKHKPQQRSIPLNRNKEEIKKDRYFPGRFAQFPFLNNPTFLFRTLLFRDPVPYSEKTHV